MQEIMNNILAATALVGIFVGGLVEGLKRTEVVSKRFLPLLSMALGMVVGYVVALGFQQDLATYTAAGFVGGAMASGVFDAIVSLLGIAKNFIGGNKE